MATTKTSIATLQKMKQEGTKISSLTAYDSSFAKLMTEQGVDFILVGDSLGNVVQGRDSTVPVTTDDMVYHTQCVRRGASDAFVIADMPFMTYSTPEQTYEVAARLMQAGANMVKLEGGQWLVETIEGLKTRGIPVCAHLGLLPQSVNVLGGYKVQGKEQQQADDTLNQALALEKAGAQLLVLECVPASLGKRITEQLSIPTIGIGAGAECDGQVLVVHDMLGLNKEFKPRFLRRYADLDSNITEAVQQYISDIKSGEFPNEDEEYS